MRKGENEKKDLLVVCNFTPGILENYQIGVPRKGKLKEIFNSDAKELGGSGVKNEQVKTAPESWHGREHSVKITIPPLAAVVFQIL